MASHGAGYEHGALLDLVKLGVVSFGGVGRVAARVEARLRRGGPSR
jgi:hypothetical protein